MRKLKTLVPVLALSALLFAGCDSIVVSQDAKDAGMKTICSSSETAVRQLDAGDSGVKTVAILIRDNADREDVQKAAAAVAEGNGTAKERQLLIDWLNEKCN